MLLKLKSTSGQCSARWRQYFQMAFSCVVRMVHICADSNHRVELLTLGWTESSFNSVVTAPSSFDIHSFWKWTLKMKKIPTCANISVPLNAFKVVSFWKCQHKTSWSRWIYLVRLGCSLQDECADALLVAVLVHDYKRMREPWCCKNNMCMLG